MLRAGHFSSPVRQCGPVRGLQWALSFYINDLPRVLSVRHPPDADGAGAFFLEDDMRNTTTTVVITAGAVLAAVIVTRTPGQEATGVGVCCYPGGYCQPVEGNLQACLDNGAIYIPTGVSCDDCPPPPGPTVTGIAVVPHFDGNGNPTGIARVFRTWSDGQTDITYVISGGNCGPAAPAGGSRTKLAEVAGIAA